MSSNNNSSQKSNTKATKNEEKSYTLFIGCIPGQTTAEDLVKAYGHIGEIFNINLKKKNNKAGSGYGTFCTKSTELFKFLTNCPQQLLGRDITCRQYLSGEEKRKYLASLHNRRIFIKKLNPAWSDQKIFEIFKDYGKIERAYAIRTSSGGSKGFGYVNFASYNDAKATLERRSVAHEGTTIEIHAYFKSKDYVPVDAGKSKKMSKNSGSTDSNQRGSPRETQHRHRFTDQNNTRGKRRRSNNAKGYNQKAWQKNYTALGQPQFSQGKNSPKKVWRPVLDFDTKEPLKCSKLTNTNDQSSTEMNHYYRNLRINQNKAVVNENNFSNNHLSRILPRFC